MTPAITAFIDGVKERLGKLTHLPYKQFPIVLGGLDENNEPNKQTLLINEYLQFGYAASQDLKLLTEMLSVALVALGKAADHHQTSVDKIYLIHQCDGYQTLAREAREKIEQMAEGK